MRNGLNKVIITALIGVAAAGTAGAQDMHFSQYYNTPMLINPANTGLMSDNDYRLGANYRTQWTAVPVPYKTFSAYADFQAFKGQNTTNWLGIGVAFYNDVAGDGNLTLTRGDLTLAYHVQTSDVFMISAGLQGGYATRTVDYNKLYFGMQWDGFKFNQSFASGENNINVIKTQFFDVGAGINFSYFPSELAFVKVGVGFAHINQPKETFYESGINELGIRPTVNMDGTFVMDNIFTLNPSIYYSMDKGASELVFGTLVQGKFTKRGNNYGEHKGEGSLIAGLHYRYKESLIGSIGLQWNDLRIMASYDYAMSSLGQNIKSYGGMEFGLVFMGRYGEHSRGAKNMNCPRFY